MTDTAFSPTDLIVHDGSAPAGTSAFGGIAGWFAGVRARWAAFTRFRRELEFISGLPDRELQDMGFTRFDVIESRRLGRWVRTADEDRW